ncbi:MAG: hypothetical protein DRI89_12405 [Bacteroidetes bacterium]|nr:MAG: hypothetical protein DRI89_12405 [Bacteroidota bacterium]
MKKLIFLFTIAFHLVFAFKIGAQCPVNITFTHQSEIDNFQTDYPDCAEIEGWVTIRGDSITNLFGLSVLTSIGEQLSIYYTSNLNSLYGLHNITGIGGSFILHGSELLENLTGLNKLDSIGEDFRISNCESLVNFSGLDSLKHIGGDVHIHSNTELQSIQGLENLHDIHGDFLIEFNPELVNFHGLNNLRHISGNAEILENIALTSLQGLNNLDSISGYMQFAFNTNLENFTGLDNIRVIEEGLALYYNEGLKNLKGIESVRRLGSLSISWNDILDSLTTFPNLTHLDGLYIDFNDSLKTLHGLDSLKTCYGVNLYSNSALQEITALSNISSLGGYDLKITGNSSLTSLNGIHNIDASSIEDLRIAGNSQLGICDFQNICSYLQSPNGFVEIYGNADGCKNPPEIAELCGFSMPCLPYGHYFLKTQEEIDNFANDYPGCKSLKGKVIITNTTINNLNGLSVIDSVSGYFKICNNDSIVNLSGLQGLKYLGSSFSIYNNENLENLVGLDSLTHIAGFFEISSNDELLNLSGIPNLSHAGALDIMHNNLLTNIRGLRSLETLTYNFVQPSIWIRNNDILVNLKGLNNIDPETINKIVFKDNPMLTVCHVESICEYLKQPDAEYTIENNRVGCNSYEEVEYSCQLVSTPENKLSYKVRSYPNPFKTTTTIQYELNQPQTIQISIYNHLGQQVHFILEEQSAGKQQVLWDARGLPSGMYYFSIRIGNETARGKMVVAR